VSFCLTLTFNAAKTTLIKYPPNISLATYAIPDGVTLISDNAFYAAKNLITVTMIDCLRTIGTSAFYGCTVLANVSLGEGLTTINPSAFGNCTALSFITFPASLTNIANGSSTLGVFVGCNNLAKIKFTKTLICAK